MLLEGEFRLGRESKRYSRKKIVIIISDKRFDDRFDLRSEIRQALIRILDKEFNVIPTKDESKSGMDTLEAASTFETTQTDISCSELDDDIAREWLMAIGDLLDKKAHKSIVLNHLRARGLIWRKQGRDYYALAAGILFLGKNPSALFPQCRILADAHRGTMLDPNPLDQQTISNPAPKMVQSIVDFVKKNTRHPPRILGLKRVVLDEYPEEAVREAIVNAIAHRNYEDKSRAIMVEVFFDRVVVSSPGPPPQPLTLAKLRRGKYRPCSRNPVIAQSLALLKLMEQRGSGLARMKSAMLEHGLDAPEFDMVDGYFQVVLPGPKDNLDRLRVPALMAENILSPSVEEQLNERQKKILAEVVHTGYVTTTWCVKMLGIVKDTAGRDFNKLIAMGLLKRSGKGRSTKYTLNISENNRPIIDR